MRDFYNVTGDCHYYVDGVLKTIFSPDENNAFCVENKGYYEMRWTITPNDEELQNIAERTIFLKVNVG